MITIVHKIQLKENTTREEFEKWVTQIDYVTAPSLKSLISFGVRRANGENSTPPYHYFEIINVTSLEEFEADMKTPQFQSLVDAFTKMAEVVEEIEGEFIPSGYNIQQ